MAVNGAMSEKALKGLHSSIDLVVKDPARKDYALKALAVHGRALQFLAPQLRADKEVVLKAVKNDGWALQWADQECRKDRELVLKAMSKDVRSLQFAAQEVLSDPTFALEALKQDGLAYEFLSPDLKQDRELARVAVTQDGHALELLVPELKQDRSLAYKAVQQKGSALEFVPHFANDLMLVSAAVRNDPGAFHWASKELQANREVWLQVCPERLEHWKNLASVEKELHLEGTVLRMADPLLKKDPEMIFQAAVQNRQVLEQLDPSTWRSKDFMLRLAREDLGVLRFAEWQSREDAMEALEVSGMALEFLPEELRADKDIVLEAVGHSGRALQFASAELRSDREVVLKALAQERTALLFAAEHLRRDKAIWLYDGEEPPFFEPPPEEEAETEAPEEEGIVVTE